MASDVWKHQMAARLETRKQLRSVLATMRKRQAARKNIARAKLEEQRLAARKLHLAKLAAEKAEAEERAQAARIAWLLQTLPMWVTQYPPCLRRPSGS
jgi:hypothetical protein